MAAPDYVARARALVPVLAEREAAAAADRNVPAATVADLGSAGLLKLLRPRAFGGDQDTLGAFLESVEILAEGCASTGWVYGVLAELNWVLACLPERGQLDVWESNPESLAVATTIPNNSAVRTDGGWRYSGRHPFGSGCRHAQWAIVGAQCDDGVPRYLAVPMTDIEIVDDWHVLGMRATGSFSLVLRDVFVPEHRTMTIADTVAGTPPGRLVHPDYALLRAPRYYVIPFVLPAAAFALARRALALVTASLRARGQLSEARMLRLGEAAALIEGGHLIFTTRRAATVAAVEAGAPIAEAEILRNRRDVVLAFQTVVRGVDQLAALAGARAVYDGDPLQAVRRDLATIATHIMVSEEAGMLPYGRFLMGGGA